MSETAGGLEPKETDQLVDTEKEAKDAKDRIFHLLTESVLVVCGIPSILFFFIGIINGLLLLIQQDEYMICITNGKANAILAGGSENDIKDRMEGHLTGSTVVWWVLILLYAQCLFMVFKNAYPFSGLVYIV
jgi:hypothetical protein